jgi:Holliday junction resolvase-like predicted endonuclease
MNNTETITPQYPDFGALLESIKESGRRMDENYARYLKEQKERDAKQDARLDKISADTNRAIKDMKNVFTTQWGRLVEALCKPAAFKLFKEHGIEIDRIYEGVHKVKDNGQDVMEIDVALCDTSVAVIVEVKSRCGSREIDHFLSQMERCKEWYPDFADKELRVAVAAIQYDDGAEKYALGKGLYVLKLSGEDTFTMSAPAKPKVF